MTTKWLIFESFGLIAAFLILTWIWWSLRPVTRGQVEKFVRESNLHLTVDSGTRVVDAIARTRLWRVIGVLMAFVSIVAFGIVQAVVHEALTISMIMVLFLLIGDYVGSVVAEFRTARSGASLGPRTASLVRRSPGNYIGDWARRWPLILGVVGAVASSVALIAGNRDLWVSAAGFGSALVAATTALVTRYVLERPQRAESADLQAADDAIRSRSLHALAGVGVGIQIWTTSLAIGGMLLTLTANDSSINGATEGLVALIFALAIPITGTFIGRRLSHRKFPIELPRSEVVS